MAHMWTSSLPAPGQCYGAVYVWLDSCWLCRFITIVFSCLCSYGRHRSVDKLRLFRCTRDAGKPLKCLPTFVSVVKSKQKTVASLMQCSQCLPVPIAASAAGSGSFCIGANALLPCSSSPPWLLAPSCCCPLRVATWIPSTWQTCFWIRRCVWSAHGCTCRA